ncbi:MAG: DDE-type integrase/transposase/recombinase [Pseudonocardiaceae bacterium]
MDTPGDRWRVAETYAKIAGRWVYLYCAIDGVEVFGVRTVWVRLRTDREGDHSEEGKPHDHRSGTGRGGDGGGAGVGPRAGRRAP